MGKIVLLDDLTINQIAAGEVIERPASVIKEMVENSIDAGATKIIVEIKNGGISYIRIVDNGSGIASDDLEIAFERHATSKIRSADDLETVKSMGFRGEALASISAVANVELVSKTEEQEIGYKVVVEGGDVLSKEEAGCPTGTSITVQNLFFNTPVRYKFLKKDYTESGYIEDAIARTALVHPEIAFKFVNSGKTIIQTNGNGDLKSVIYSIYGKDIASAVLDADYTYDDIKITGVVGKPEIARSNRSNQIFFVNKRYIKDKNLSAAVSESFKGMIPLGKFGFVVLNIEMNPSKVDVNVHPAKLEVRFEEENKVFKAVFHAIKEALSKGELIENVEKAPEDKTVNNNVVVLNNEEIKQNKFKSLLNWKKAENKNSEIENKENLLEKIYKKRQAIEENNVEENKNKEIIYNVENEINEEVKEEDVKYQQDTSVVGLSENDIVDFQTKKDNIKTENTQANAETENTKNLQSDDKAENIESIENEFAEAKSKIDEMINESQEVTPDFTEMYYKTFGTMPKIEQDSEKKNEVKEENKELDAMEIINEDNTVSIFEESKENEKVKYKFLGIAFNTYIIFEIEQELYIMDQHAAHERIMYEKVKKNYYSTDEKNSQLLLLPDIITLTHKEMDIARENMKMFERAGFMLEEFGENTIKLSGVPDICLDLDTRELFMETLDEINAVARTAKQEIEERFLATVACKAAVKAHMVLAKEEVDSLMEELLKLPNPFTCPHGRPTVIKMTKYDLDKKFARR